MATATRRGAARVGERQIDAQQTRDRALLRSFLDRDRLRAAYAICDLEEREFGRTRWGIATEADEVISVVLEYGGLTPQPLFVMGDTDGISAILRDELGAVEGHYRIDSGPPMLRMAVDRQSFRPAAGSTMRLLPVEIGDLNRLYGLGFTAWLPADSVASGVYYGMRVDGKLVAAAGTHVISPDARLGVVGNVMTAPDHRGRGYAKATTSAVTAELLRTCEDVVLNVRSDNPPAVAAYRALGYTEYWRFEERLVHRRGAPWDSIVDQLRMLLTRSKES
jgi:ribosomal protein S18 acetylase RimI-like enzyme